MEVEQGGALFARGDSAPPPLPSDLSREATTAHA
jgi:hypothetical protein